MLEVRQPLVEVAGRQDAPGPCILDHEGEPLWGIVGIEGQVGGAGLERGQDGDDHLERALQADGDNVLGPDALGDEPPGELVGARLELRIGQFPIFEDQRDVLRRLGGLALEEVDEGRLGDRRGGVVEVVEEPATLMRA